MSKEYAYAMCGQCKAVAETCGQLIHDLDCPLRHEPDDENTNLRAKITTLQTQLAAQCEATSVAVERDGELLMRMYSLAPDPKECCDDCPFQDWYDGPLCLVAGDYVETQPSEECKKYRAMTTQPTAKTGGEGGGG